MSAYTLEIELLSDTSFGIGAGLSGVVDAEIQQDELGLPMLNGRAIKGLLVNECAALLETIQNISGASPNRWQASAQRLFGERGQTEFEHTRLVIANATVAPDLRAALAGQDLEHSQVIDSLTSIRRQTAMSVSGAPDDETLRAIRVVIRNLKLYAPLTFIDRPISGSDKSNADDQALLAACVLALRRAGQGRNRGRGRIKVLLTDRPLDPTGFANSEDYSKELTLDWLNPLEEDLKR